MFRAAPGQADAFDIFHRQEMHIAGLLGIEGGHDIGMRQAGRGADLAAKTLDGRRLVDQLAVEHLEGDRPFHEQMLRLVYRPHAADT
jgi:hypothetical protein